MKKISLALAAAAATVPMVATTAYAAPAPDTARAAKVITIAHADPLHDVTYVDRGGSVEQQTGPSDLRAYRIRVVRKGAHPHVRVAFRVKRIVRAKAKYERAELYLGRKQRIEFVGTVGRHRVDFAKNEATGSRCHGGRLAWSRAAHKIWMTVPLHCFHAHGVFHRALQPSTQLEDDTDDVEFWFDEGRMTRRLPLTRAHRG